MICTEFNDGKGLEYRWTRNDGYWKMTKGFPSGGKEISLKAVAEALETDRLAKEHRKKKKKPAVKKVVHTKYKGD